MSDERRMHPAARVPIGLVAAAVAAFGAFVAWFGGVVTWSGCFIDCTEPDRLAAVAFFVVFAGLVGGSLVAVDFMIRGWDRTAARQVFLWGLLAGAILAVLSAVGS